MLLKSEEENIALCCSAVQETFLPLVKKRIFGALCGEAEREKPVSGQGWLCSALPAGSNQNNQHCPPQACHTSGVGQRIQRGAELESKGLQGAGHRCACMQVCSCGASGLASSGSAVLLQVLLLHCCGDLHTSQLVAAHGCAAVKAECFRWLNYNYLYSFKLNSCSGCLI